MQKHTFVLIYFYEIVFIPISPTFYYYQLFWSPLMPEKKFNAVKNYKYANLLKTPLNQLQL